MKTVFTTVALILLTISFSYAQAPEIMWQKCLGSYKGEYPHSIRPTTDGGFIIAGYTEGNGPDVTGYHGTNETGDYWIVKLSAAGNIEWQKCLGTSFVDLCYDVRQTADGGYILAGSSWSNDCNITGNHGILDYWIVKLQPNGDIAWQKMIGGSKSEYAQSIDITPDGGYIVAGYTQSSDGDLTLNHGNVDYWVVKIDGTGNIQWQKSLGGSGDDLANGVRATSDGGCIVTGYTESIDGDVTGNHGSRDYWVVKLGNGGTLQWQKCLGGSGREMASSVQLTTDGGYIVAGQAGSNDGDVSGNHNPPGADFWVVKLTSGGAVQWQKCYGGNYNDIPYYIQTTPDGGYVLTGSAESTSGDVTCNAGYTDLWVIKISSTGVLQWQKTMGGTIQEEGYSVQPLNDGTYIVAGITCSSNISGHYPNTNPNATCADYWIIKLSAAGIPVTAPVVTIAPTIPLVCTGNSNTFKASVLYGGTNTVYQWVRNGNTVGTNSSMYTASDFANNDVLVCNVTAGGACVTSSLQSSATVTIKTSNAFIQPQVTISSSSTAICNCTQINFTATVVNGGALPAFQWMVNGVNTGATGNQYSSNLLKAGDVVSCVYSDNAACIVNGSVTSNSITMNGGGTQTASVSIKASLTTICLGLPVTFTASPVNAGSNPSYQWKVNGNNAGSNAGNFITNTLSNGDVVTCTITPDPLNACINPAPATSNQIAIVVTGKLNPSVVIKTSSNTICTGTSVTFTATASDAGANPSFQWQLNGLNTGANSSSFTSSTLADGDKISCTITTDPLFNCASSTGAVSNEIIITVTSQANPSITIAASANEVCKGTPVTFNAVAENAGTNPAYQWIVNNTTFNNNSTEFNTNNLLNGNEVYCIVIPGAGACSTAPVTSNIITAVINDMPVVTVSPVDTTINIGNRVTLKATVTGNTTSFNWNPSNKLTDPFSLNTTTTPLTENTTYTLTAATDKGCEASAMAIVKVSRVLVMPNAFSPNGDGLNDLFRIPSGVLIEIKEFSVFDRWGNKVFTTRLANKGWDGSFNGKPANTGSYVYIIKGTNYQGTVSVKGNVVLVR